LENLQWARETWAGLIFFAMIIRRKHTFIF
jgi:hypothetical protein